MKDARITTRGGFLVTIEEADPFDEDAALIGSALRQGERIGVVWRRNGEARWLGHLYDLQPEWVDALVREYRKDG